MAAQVGREWTGLQQFPAATQTKLHDLLGKLKQEVQFSRPSVPFNLLSVLTMKTNFGMLTKRSSLTAKRIKRGFRFEMDAKYEAHIITSLLLLLMTDIFVIGSEHIDHPCHGERWGWKIFPCELYHRGKSGSCQCFPGINYCC